jgi:hypothetical protein
VQNLGYAVAIVEQLCAEMLDERLRSLSKFSEYYLSYKTPGEAIKDFDSTDTVNLLFDFIIALSDRFALLGLLKSLTETVHRRMEPKAGPTPGNTDIMFELHQILALDDLRFEKIAEAVTEANAYSKALGSREKDVERYLNDWLER